MSLFARKSPGKFGVTHWSFADEHAKLVGKATTMGATIGDVEVRTARRGHGYGTQIVRFLIARGGRVAYPGSEAGAATMRRAGMKLTRDGRFVFPGRRS